MNDIHEAAIQYAEIGLAVIPIRGKRPFMKGWPDLATTDKAQIADWFPEGLGLNVGILTGDLVFVVDCDGEEGIEALATLQEQHGQLPRTPKSHTGGGGEHWYFLMPPNRSVENSIKLHGLSIDVRGERGQVVAPPSVHENGNLYEWIDSPFDVSFAEAPEWLLDWIDGASGSSSVKTHDGGPPNLLGGNNDFDTTEEHLKAHVTAGRCNLWAHIWLEANL
jgi:hypothetical protein